MKKTRVLLVTPLFPPEIGGPATYAKLLSSKLPQRGFDVDVLAFSEVRHLPKVISHIIFFLKVLLRGIRADVLLVLDLVSVGWPAYFANLFLRKRFITKFVGDHVWEQMSQRTDIKQILDNFKFSYIKHPYFAFLRTLQFTVAKGSEIITPSQYLKEVLIGWGVNLKNISVIHNAFSAPQLDKTKEELRKELGQGGHVIISAGRLVPWKGFDTLIDLMPEIVSEIADVHLYIAGDGPDKDYLQSKIKEANAQKLVTLLGRVPQEELFKQIKAADLFVLNTSYEGLSHQLLEVMALETPIVTTRAGGNVETVDDGESGILVEYNDKAALKDSIIKCLKDREMSKNFVENAKKKLDFFGEERMLAEISDFLKN